MKGIKNKSDSSGLENAVTVAIRHRTLFILFKPLTDVPLVPSMSAVLTPYEPLVQS